MTSNISLCGSPSAQIGILYGLRFQIDRIINDFIYFGRVNPEFDLNDIGYECNYPFSVSPSHPIVQAIYALRSLVAGGKKVVPSVEYNSLMFHRYLLPIECKNLISKQFIETKEQKTLLQLLKIHAKLLKEAQNNLLIEEDEILLQQLKQCS